MVCHLFARWQASGRYKQDMVFDLRRCRTLYWSKAGVSKSAE